MKEQKNITKACHTNVGAIINCPFFEGITKNNNKYTHGITLIALVITIILLLILAGVVLNLTLGEHGIIKQAEQAGEQYKISEILEKLELEKVDLVARKNGEVPSLQEYIGYLINKGIITISNVTDIDANNKNIVVEGYLFLVEKEASGNIKITYQGKPDNTPRIAKLQVTGTTIDSISVKVVASNADGASYKYSIKNITAGETDFIEETTLNRNEYTFTGLTINNDYIIQVELITADGGDTKETDTIKTEAPKVTSITLDKTNIDLVKGETDIIIATVLPENAIDKTITWTSSNVDVVTVDDEGNIEAIGEGVAIITATSNEVSTVIANCNITVTPPPPPSVGVGADVHEAHEIPYTWEELNELAKIISDNYGEEEGQINNDTAEVNVSINGKSDTLGIGDWTTVKVDGVAKQVRILGFNHDELTDKTVYGGTNTYAGISFEFNETIGQVWKVQTIPYGGWEASELRCTLNNTTLYILENSDYIKKVNKMYIGTYNQDSSLSYSSDWLWLLSAAEIYYGGALGWKSVIICADGYQYKFYKDKVTRYDKGYEELNKIGGYWWLRSKASMYTFLCIMNGGKIGGTNGTANIIPAFAI